jgi:hypothetical protein
LLDQMRWKRRADFLSHLAELIEISRHPAYEERVLACKGNPERMNRAQPSGLSARL